jgi:hypothetical protein
VDDEYKHDQTEYVCQWRREIKYTHECTPNPTCEKPFAVNKRGLFFDGNTAHLRITENTDTEHNMDKFVLGTVHTIRFYVLMEHGPDKDIVLLSMKNN